MLKRNRCGAPAAFVVGQLLLTSRWDCISGLWGSDPSANPVHPSGKGHGQGRSTPAARLLNTPEVLWARENSRVRCSANDLGGKTPGLEKEPNSPYSYRQQRRAQGGRGPDGTFPVPSPGALR